jgi:predicted Zn-dependent protease
MAFAIPLLLCSTMVVWAQERVSLIRDAEIETIIRTYATPIFEAAGLAPSDIKINLVNDSRLNAFVANGLNLFINTGLIQKTTHPNQLIGVIAHETGHIAGGHLVRLRDEMENMGFQALIGAALGAAAAAASGDGGAGAAIALGSQEMARRNFLQYSRSQESSADHAALRFLDQAGISSKGLAEFLETLGDQELLSSTRQDPYLRTHPITQDRIEAARQHAAHSPNTNNPEPADLLEMHRRMIAKLDGFLLPSQTVLARYKPEDRSISARYARAIAFYRQPDLTQALPLIDGLLAESPNNPYFHELRGQMLFENGKVAEALPSYERAVRLLPSSGLLRQELGRASIETGDPGRIKEAIIQLGEAARIEPRNSGTWHLLGIAYGKDGQMGMASLALAESALLRGHRNEAMAQAERAKRGLQQGTASWLRAEDIKRAAETRS